MTKPVSEGFELIENPSPRVAARIKEFEAAVKRVGETPQTKVEWVVRIANAEIDLFSEGDLLNLSRELQVFMDETNRPPNIYTSIYKHLLEIYDFLYPRVDVTCEVLKDLQWMIERILNRENIPLGEIKTNYLLEWFGDRLMKITKEVANYKEKTRLIMSNLAPNFAHLIRRCSAHKAHGKGEICGEIFLARRTDQSYCSSECRTRATTKIHREKRNVQKRGKGAAKKAKLGVKGKVGTRKRREGR